MSSRADMKLPENLEKLLADMPLPDRDWEALAARTVERALLATDTPSGLLDPPLPPEEGEPGFERKEPPKEPVAARAAAAVSLAELARASVKKKDEGTKDIALESLAVATQARAQVDEIAERVQAATQKARVSTPDAEPAPQPVAESAPPKAEPPARSASPAQVKPQGSPARGPWIVAGFAVLAAAAAIAISQRPTSEPAPLVVNDVKPAPLASAAQAPAAPEAEATPAAPAPAPAPEAPAEPQAVAQAAPSPGRAPLAHAPKGAAAAPAAPSGVAPDKIVLEDEEPSSPPPPAAAPPASAKMVPAELPRGGLPDKPSAGAAYAAIGPYMGAARACVSGHDDPSTARIVFSSDGSVQSVSVSGPAAGTPAATCIENALKKARVQPFASPTFSMSTPVRPQ